MTPEKAEAGGRAELLRRHAAVIRAARALVSIVQLQEGPTREAQP
jgi:hypothetical protein